LFHLTQIKVNRLFNLPDECRRNSNLVGLKFFQMKLFILILIAFNINLQAQTNYIDICKGWENQRFLDTNVVLRWYDAHHQDSFTTTPKVVFMRDSMPYIAIPLILGTKKGSSVIAYYREDSIGNLYRYDSYTNKAVLIIPADTTKIGYEVEIHNQFGELYTFKIMGFNEKLMTPYCNYTNVIKMATKRADRFYYDEFNYFKRGIWVVGVATALVDTEQLFVWLEYMYSVNEKK
jgi:hypothetical protein